MTAEQWQPIATAPKDTPLLLWDMGYRNEETAKGLAVIGYWEGALSDWCCCVEGRAVRFYPSHWMLLPEAPK